MRILKENEVSGIIENLRGKVEKVEFLIRDYVDDSGRQYKTLAVIRLNDFPIFRRRPVFTQFGFFAFEIPPSLILSGFGRFLFFFYFKA